MIEQNSPEWLKNDEEQKARKKAEKWEWWKIWLTPEQIAQVEKLRARD